MKRTALLIATAVFSLGFFIALLPSSAAKAFSCIRHDISWNQMAQTSGGAGGEFLYWYTGNIKVPYSWQSDCKDINVANLSVPNSPSDCAYFRIKWASNPTPTGWKWMCPSSQWQEVFYGAPGGQYYSLHVKPVFPEYRPEYTIYD